MARARAGVELPGPPRGRALRPVGVDGHDQALPFVVPQEHGLHLDTVWFELTRAGLDVRIAGDRPLAFSALHHSSEDLTAATHAHLLAARPETFVHLDVAHRGLGTFACGPDTHDRFKLHGATYRFRWTLTA